MTNPMPTRINEAQADLAITRLLLSSPVAQRQMLAAIGPDFCAASVLKVDRQKRHAIDTGSIDLVLHLSNGWRLLVENKIGPAPVLFRSFESDTRHQGDRIWQRYTATSSSGMRFALRSPVA